MTRRFQFQPSRARAVERKHAVSHESCRLTQKLLKAVDASHVAVTPERLEISLLTEWRSLLSALDALGECLSVARNRGAIAGICGPHPRLSFSDDLLQAQSCCGTLDFDLRFWNSASVIAEDRVSKRSHYIDFRDGAGDSIYRVCLTESSDAEAFVEWTQLFQGKGSASSGRNAQLTDRCRSVQQRHWFSYEEADELCPDAVCEFLAATIEQRVPICCLVGNEGVVQAVDFVPVSLRPSSGWTFLSSDTTGIHFDSESFGSVIVHRIAHPFSEGHVAALKCFDDRGSLSLVFMPSCMKNCEAWNDFLTETTRSHLL